MATNSLTEERFAHVLQCPICLETIRRPKVLPCGHTYCDACLQSHINSTVIKRGTPQMCFPCPVCRVDTTSPDTTANVDQWADLFPVNNIVSSILDEAVETIGEKLCYLCLKWNRNTSAKSFCKNCKRLMCKLCEEHHNETLSGISHDVCDLNIENDPSARIPSLTSIEICLKHPNKGIEFVCMDHNSICCSTCGFLEHRKCERVIPIEDMLKTFDAKAKSQDLEANIRNIGEHVKELSRKVKENADSIKQEKANILQQIKTFRLEMTSKLQKLEDDLIASLEACHKPEELTLHNQEVRGLSLTSAISIDLTQLDLAVTHGSELQKVIMLHKMEKNQISYLKAISEYQEDLKNIKIGLEVNNNLQGLINGVKLFGEITVYRNKLNLPLNPTIIESLSKPEKDVGSCVTQLKERKAVKVSEFSVKESGDKLCCCISDILILNNGKTIFVDFNNMKVKVYGENNQLQDKMTFEGQPWNACILPDNNMAVTLPYNKTVLVIGICNKMHKVREIKTRLECWGIAAMKDNLVITTGSDQHSVLILDKNGSAIKSYQPVNYESERLLRPFYIKVDRPETIAYISYHNGDKMVAYNTSWDIMFAHTYKDMAGPCGIDTDREGNIYLCGYNSLNIQQISADGKLINTLVTKTEDMRKPLAIKFFRHMDRFLLTYYSCDNIEVYDMSD